MFDMKKVNDIIAQAEETLTQTRPFDKTKGVLVGVDLGTASIVMVVLDAERNPVASALTFSKVVKDGLVVDYMGAIQIVRKLKAQLQERLQMPLEAAAIAIPPGTSKADSKTHQHILEACGFSVTAIEDEPTAANQVLQIENGVIVDIGGGTTGLSIFENGKVVSVADEATGGVHLSLVLSGRYQISFDQAEKLKKDTQRQKEVFLHVRPVIEKMATIVNKYIQGYGVTDLYLVGGTCCLPGVEDIFYKVTGIPTHKPKNPFFVTPLGIAMMDHGQENNLKI